MGHTAFDELLSALPAVTETESAPNPVRDYEQLAHAMRALVEVLETKPPGEEVLGVLDTGLERLKVNTGACDATLFVLDEHSRELSFVIVKGSVPAEKLQWRTLARGYGIAGWVAEHGKHIVCNDTSYDSRFCKWFDQELSYKTKTVLAVPIRNYERTLGVVELINKVGKGLFTDSDLSNAMVFANLTGQVLDDLTSRGEKTLP